jgi:hypothetical protein
MGLPYVLSSDLVSAYPAKSLAIAEYVDDLIPLLAMTQNAQTGVTYSFVLTDFTKLVTLSNASAVAVTLPLEATVAWPTGTQLRLLNLGAGTVTVAGAVGVTINGTPLTLAQYKGAILTKTGTNTWVFLPFSGGSAPAVISSTTGSPTITTDGTATVYTFTGDGTIVVGTAGVIDLLLIGGGGGGGSNQGGGGGGGGRLYLEDFLLSTGTATVRIGAGGAATVAGSPSDVASLYAYGGGQGSNVNGTPGAKGGSGGGGSTDLAGGAGLAAQGFAGAAGGVGSSSTTGGGGGAGAAATSQNGAAGAASTITGTSVTKAGGGGGGNTQNQSNNGTATNGGGGGGFNAIGTAGTANAGGGGGGGGNNISSGFAGAAGGSGVVIVRVG